MTYLNQFIYPSADQEFSFFNNLKTNCDTAFYPFQALARHNPITLNFGPITILYGNNGSGKSTALSVMANKLGLLRSPVYNRSRFFEDYVALCEAEASLLLPAKSCLITSDDVFDYMFDLRSINLGIDHRRTELFADYTQKKHSKFVMQSLDDYEGLKASNLAKRMTQSRFIRDQLPTNVRGKSNGENALMYFTQKIDEPGLYLLDEPENSLSPQRQMELAQYLSDSVRYFGAQIVMATHSPFLLAISDAIIYDLDQDPICTSSWEELEHIKCYEALFNSKRR